MGQAGAEGVLSCRDLGEAGLSIVTRKARERSRAQLCWSRLLAGFTIFSLHAELCVLHEWESARSKAGCVGSKDESLSEAAAEAALV